MVELWDYARRFLSALPSEVFQAEVHICSELKGSWEGGPAIKKLKFPESKGELEVLQDFLGLLEEESQMQEVLKSSVEDYVDETYSRPEIEPPTPLSYFN
jgi:hypothetical protein